MNMKLFSFLLIYTISSVLAFEYYDPGKDLCCGGIIQGSANRVTRCCGNRTYDTDNEICCDYGSGEIAKKPNQQDKSTHYRCCNGKATSQKESLCCENTIVPIPQNKVTSYYDFYCCGKEMYNRTESLCCDNTVKNIPKDKGTRYIYNYECCGKEIYYRPEMICCVDKLQPKASNKFLECCVDKAYENEKQLCCGGVLHERTNPGDKCCNGKIYNSEDMECLYGKPESIIVPRIPRNGTVIVCKGEVYVTGLQDKVTPICCGDTLYRVEDSDLKCCGTILYNTTHQKCCYNSVLVDGKRIDKSIVYKLPAGQSDKIFCGKNQLYNIETEKYCDGEYVKLADDVGERKQLCCKNEFS